MTEPRRVAVVGLGVIAAAGTGIDDFWERLNSAPPEGERRVHNFDPEPLYASAKHARRADRSQQFAAAATAQAMADAGDMDVDSERFGVIYGTGVGGLQSYEKQVLIHDHKGAHRVSPFMVPMMMPNASAAFISMEYGLQGPAEVITTACASSTHSLGYAARLISFGLIDAAVAGGCESAMSAVGMAGFNNMTAISTSGISRPFDRDRDGFMMAEAAATLILEDMDRALARNAVIHGEILGSASNADAYHITAPAPGGVGALRCMKLAIKDAGLTPTDIAHVNAHGTATPLNDVSEAEALSKLFGDSSDGGPLITSTKGVTGHAMGAAGAIEALAVLLAMRHEKIPPTAGWQNADPDMAPINLVTGTAASWTPGPSLSNSFGFGGHNGCLVLGPPPT